MFHTCTEKPESVTDADGTRAIQENHEKNDDNILHNTAFFYDAGHAQCELLLNSSQ